MCACVCVSQCVCVYVCVCLKQPVQSLTRPGHHSIIFINSPFVCADASDSVPLEIRRLSNLVPTFLHKLLVTASLVSTFIGLSFRSKYNLPANRLVLIREK